MAELLLAAAAEAIVALLAGLAWETLRRTLAAVIPTTRQQPPTG